MRRLSYFKKPFVLPIIALLIFIVTSTLLPTIAHCRETKLEKSVRIGVLAHRGTEEALKTWTLTAYYLTSKIPRYSFTIVPLGFHEINKAVERGEVDFVLANSSIYVELEALYGVSRIATMKALGPGYTRTTFGGVIITRTDRNDIKTLNDLKGKSFMAVDETSLGGWRAAWRELKANGINPYKNFSSLQFGDTHDAVVYAVRDGRVDAGTVRTDVLEHMEMDGRINIKTFRVLNPKEHEGFPFVVSTRLYPEWPFAKVKHTPTELAEKVATALLAMSENSPAAKAAKIAGWTIPLDYQPVHECLKELRVGPYKDIGKVTPADVLRQYRHWIILSLSALFIMCAATAYVSRLNRKLNQSRDELEHARNELEQRVKERTAELQAALTNARNAENELHEQLHFLQILIDTLPNPIFYKDAEGRYLGCNAAFEKYISLTKGHIIGKTVYDIAPKDLADIYYKMDSALFQQPGIQIYESSVVYADGTRHEVIFNKATFVKKDGTLGGLVGIILDVTERRKIEDQLRHAQKMEAMGTLTGGVAHDFNNILTAIIGYGSLVRIGMKEDDPFRPYIKEILSAAEKATNLTRSLLAFSKKQIINPKPVNLSEIIRGIEKLLLRVIGEDVELRIMLNGEDLTIMADPGQIEQVLMNLCTNSRDAMPDGGLLTIETKIVTLDSEYIKTHGYGEIGKYALVSITDTGIGMDENTRERIFEPFFTTKELGKGTGLGLAMAYGIIKQHNGYINVYSEPCKGTTFKIYLPLIKSEIAGAEPDALPPPKRGSETVLVAEDEAAVRKLTRDVLEGYGYKAIEAEDGEDAINKFMENKEGIHILLFDLIMPKKNGKEAYEEISRIRPDIKAIFMSGYTADIIHKKGILEKGLNFISKPVSPDELLRRVREVLDKEE